MDFVFDLQRFAKIDWNVPNGARYYLINYTENLNLNSDDFAVLDWDGSTEPPENGAYVALARQYKGLIVRIVNATDGAVTGYSGHVYGNIEVVDGIDLLMLYDANREIKTVSKGTWKLDETFTDGVANINLFALVVYLDKDVAALYYDAGGKNITGGTLIAPPSSSSGRIPRTATQSL